MKMGNNKENRGIDDLQNVDQIVEELLVAIDEFKEANRKLQNFRF